MKNKFLLFLCLLATILILASCGQTESPKQEQETTIEQPKEALFSYVLLQDDTYEVSLKNANGKTEITIPTEYNGKAVNKISDYGFANQNELTSIIVSEGISEIGRNAFANCGSLNQITLPNSLKTLGVYAFHYCISLKNITLPVQIKNISNGLFFGCSSLNSVTFNGAVTTIGNASFASCTALKTITFPQTLQEIGSFAFYSCDSLSHLALPEYLITLSDYVFYHCPLLESVIVPNYVEKIGRGTFPEDTLVCYLGSRDNWNAIQKSQDYTYARYTESEPTSTTLKWHYNEDGIPEHWHYTNTVTNNPTCTEAGYKQITCIHCGYQSYQRLAPLGGSHNFVNGICTKCGKNAIKLTPLGTHNWLQFSELEYTGNWTLDYDLVFANENEQQNTCVWITMGNTAYFSRMQRRTDTTFTITSQLNLNGVWSENQHATVENSARTIHIRFERVNSTLTLSVISDGGLSYTYTLTNDFLDGQYDLSQTMNSIMFQSEGGTAFSVQNISITKNNVKQTEFTFYDNNNWTIENQ